MAAAVSLYSINSTSLAGCFFPSLRQTCDIAGPSQDDAVWHCLHACDWRHVWVALSLFRSAGLDDSFSPPASDNTRFAEWVDRQPCCKSHAPGMFDSAREKVRLRYHPDALGS